MATIVVGLDGAHWELLNPWIEAGHLPNLSRIRSEGVWGDLQSCLPPVTSPNWKCYSTGKNPGGLGVYWWEIVDIDEQEVKSPDSRDYTGTELWDYLTRAGLSTAVINMPTTYPPNTKSEWLVAGGPGAGDTDYTKPAALEMELREELDYHVHPERPILPSTTPDDPAVESHLDAIDSRFDVVERLLAQEGADFLHVTTFYVNVLQHYFWDDDPTFKAWTRIDARVGDLMEAGHGLLLMSDHGSTPIDWQFNLNLWLEREGYLSVKPYVNGALQSAGITRERVLSFLDPVPFRDAVLGLVPDTVKNNVPSEDGTLPKSTKGDLIDWQDSRAVASGQGPIYVLEDDPEERRTLVEELETRLSELRAPDGSLVYDSVHRGTDLYEGDTTGVAPALMAEQNAGFHVPGSLGGSDVFTRPERWTGENKRTGLFAAWGEDVTNDGRINGNPDPVRIVDLMPTVLHWMGVGVPTDVDGIVRTEFFEPDSDPVERDVERTKPISADDEAAEGSDELEDRLEELGYL